MRAGLPSVVKETLAKSADFTIFVRDRKPFVRFSERPMCCRATNAVSGAERQPKAVALSIYRIETNLVDTLRYGFQREQLQASVWGTNAARKSGTAN